MGLSLDQSLQRMATGTIVWDRKEKRQTFKTQHQLRKMLRASFGCDGIVTTDFVANLNFDDDTEDVEAKHTEAFMKSLIGETVEARIARQRKRIESKMRDELFSRLADVPIPKEGRPNMTAGTLT